MNKGSMHYMYTYMTVMSFCRTTVTAAMFEVYRVAQKSKTRWSKNRIKSH